MENDRYRVKNHIIPHFNNKPLKRITLDDCQSLITRLDNEGKGKTCDEVFSILNQTFKYAIANHVITENPMTLVLHEKHENEHGVAFTKEEEKNLLDIIKNTRFYTPIILSLYAGLRPNEIETAIIENDFIVAKNSKRKNKKIEYKRIPITPMMRPHIPYLKLEQLPPLKATQEFFSKSFPSRRFYDLRTTFNSRCQEYNVTLVAISKFMGHSLGKLQDAYTSLSNEYYIQEGNKLNYKL